MDDEGDNGDHFGRPPSSFRTSNLFLSHMASPDLSISRQPVDDSAEIPGPGQLNSLPHPLLSTSNNTGTQKASIFGPEAVAEAETYIHHEFDFSYRRPETSRTRPATTDQPRPGARRQTVGHRLLPQVEKDGDDINAAPSSSRGLTRQESTTLTTLSRLFAVHAATSPEPSSHASTTTPPLFPSVYSRSIHSSHAAALPQHLYNRGLLSGRHSDITVHAFGYPYRLHRIILDQAPFFASALSEPWLEANAKEMTVHPQDIDASITQAAFDLALKRLYGCCDVAEEDQNPVGLFATGCWLEIPALIDSSIESMLRQMTPETLSPLMKLVTNNYYGRAGDKVLASAKSMLCRDGWRMPLKYWDGIPGDIVREIVGGDGFFIDGEWDRWVLTKRILDRRLRQQAISAGLLESGSSRRVQKVPESASLMAFRFDTVHRKSATGSGRGVSDSLQKWITLYTQPDIEPLLVLLDEGIHYIHLDFEQLQYIRGSKDCLGLPVMPDRVVRNALWQQMELRQKVMNAQDAELELDISVQCNEDAAMYTSRETTMSIHASSETRPKGKRKVDESEKASDEIDSESWDGNGKPRKFWIPNADCNMILGNNPEPIIASMSTIQRHASRLSGTLHPEDAQWAADFAAAASQSQPRIPITVESPNEPLSVSYTHFPPFRFSAEFPNPRHLKDKKRTYSRTVFYAGSLWNIYIQKVSTSRSKQLGVYLHRAKERETEEVIAGTAGLAQGSVDERIGQLERDMIMRSERRERRQRRRTTIGSDTLDGEDVDSSGSAGVEEISSAAEVGSTTRASTIRNLLSRRQHKDGQTDILASSPPATSNVANDIGSHLGNDAIADSDTDENDSETERLTAASKRLHIPTLPPYVDGRPTIKTYFKIYSPSRAGRMLSVYESAPDKFNFSQSWGWKSSTLMLDEGLLGDDDDGKDGGVDSGEKEGESTARMMKGKGDGKLRFSVVVGIV